MSEPSSGEYRELARHPHRRARRAGGRRLGRDRRVLHDPPLAPGHRADRDLTDQTDTRQLRRILTFPGQPKTTEELVSMDNDDFHYRYKWHAGDWGERVKNYHASLRVLAGDLDTTSVVQWQSTFAYPTDAITDFYEHGFRALLQRFPLTRRST